MASDEGGSIRLADLIDLDESAPPASNAERARQQAAFHAREAVELGDLIAADRAASRLDERARDPRQAERSHHRTLELICREIAEAFDWLGAQGLPSGDLERGLEHVRAGYDCAPEIALLRRIAGTEYPLLTAITLVRPSGVGLLTETRLSLKHAARGRALADALSTEDAEALFAGWLDEAIGLGERLAVNLLAVHQAIEWLVHLAAARARPGHGRLLEDDLEAALYLARGTLGETGFTFAGPVDPPPGY